MNNLLYKLRFPVVLSSDLDGAVLDNEARLTMREAAAYIEQLENILNNYVCDCENPCPDKDRSVYYCGWLAREAIKDA
jgi:hypothetical protein